SKALDSVSVRFYAGFDPTGPSLHVGHMVPLFAMAHLQKAGHRPIAVVGGGTARIGDPSGKTETRKMLTVQDIKKNAECLKKQISRFITFDNEKALMVDNADWLAPLNYINFLRDIGRHFSVNRMLSFETYKMRLETGLSFIEFNYQLLQSYDFLVLFQKYGCTLQIGGDDQWGNIIMGMELIRRIEGKEAHGLTFPLVTRTDGKKMGKTEKGSLFLNPEMTAPYDFYQYWVNIPDDDVENFLLIFTFLSVKEIKQLSSLKNAEINRAKEILAFELTKTIHGEAEAVNARDAAKALFGKGGDGDLAAMPSIHIAKPEIENGINVVDLFARTSLCSSKAEARRLITQGGAFINDTSVSDINTAIYLSEKKELPKDIKPIFLNEKNPILRAGKKRYFRIIID
ncbi:MAG: tyrosine--tRNA ligase, partial [Spirochaetaceae bacterium]